MSFRSKSMSPTIEDKVQFIILQYKCLGHFDCFLDDFIFFGFRGEDEYSGYNRLFVYDLCAKSVVFDDFYLKDSDLEICLTKILQRRLSLCQKL